jgi:AcrR family transcriptional regulator
MTHREQTATRAPTAGSEARERLIAAAYELFCQRGVRAVGVDAIIERAGVARQTLYRQFGSKEELVLAFLERREEVWSRRWLQAQVLGRAVEPRERLLTVFDLFDDWFHASDYEGCPFINVMLEHPDDADPVHRAAVDCLDRVRDFVAELMRQAGIGEAERRAQDWQMLMHGAIVAATGGDREAAVRDKRIAAALLER